jgi:hypothetical protein
MYATGHPNLAHYKSVLLIIRPKKPVIAQSLSLFPMEPLTPSVMSQYLCMSPISSLAPLERSLGFSVFSMVSENLLKACIFSFWMSLKLKKMYILAHFFMTYGCKLKKKVFHTKLPFFLLHLPPVPFPQSQGTGIYLSLKVYQDFMITLYIVSPGYMYFVSCFGHKALLA